MERTGQLGGGLLGALLLVGAASAPAQEPPLTFPRALDLAVANNLDLAAARRGRAVRQAEVTAAGQHPNPDLVFETTRDTPHPCNSRLQPCQNASPTRTAWKAAP